MASEDVREVIFALGVLQRLPKLIDRALDNPKQGEYELILKAMEIVRCYYRCNIQYNYYVQVINVFTDDFLNGTKNDEHVDSISSEAQRLQRSFLQQRFPQTVALILMLIVSLGIAEIPLIVIRSEGCCSKNQIVAIVFSVVIISLGLILYPLIYMVIQNSSMTNYAMIMEELVKLHFHLGQQVKTGNTPNESNQAIPGGMEIRPTQLLEDFLLEGSTSRRQTTEIKNLIIEATEDYGEAIFRSKGLPPALLSLGAINRHTIIVITDLDGQVCFWSEGATVCCGFSSRDAEGGNILSLLSGDKSIEMHSAMVSAASRNMDLSEKILTLAHMTHGSISVRASVIGVRDAESNSPIGYALIGSVQTDEVSRLQSIFHNFFITELSHFPRRDAHFKQLVGCLRWNSLRDLSALAQDWGNVLVWPMLSNAIKSRQHDVEVEIDPQVTALPQMKCDVMGVQSIMTKLLEMLPGKTVVKIEQKRTTETVCELNILCQHNTTEIRRESLSSVAQSANALGGYVVALPGSLKLCLPFLMRGEAIQTMQPHGSFNATGQDPLTVLLLEKNAVQRHNISVVVWKCGHSLRVVENVSSALQAIEESTDLGCAIIDADIREVQVVLDALQAKNIYCIEVSETPEEIVNRGNIVLKKPILPNALRDGLDVATQKVEEAKKADEERMKRQEVFGKVRNSPWTLGRFLGRGAFATVYEVTSTLTGGKMAVKMIDVGNFEDRIHELMNEIEILCKLNHPNIIHYFYCERTETTLNLFMALADQGTVEDLLQACPMLSENLVATITKQLLQAVKYLHECDIIHRDIKPANMLISQGQMKLSDFGTATTNVRMGIVGTPYYMAPEVIDGAQSGKESDVWSIGCVVCKCLQIERPGGILGFGAPEHFEEGVSPDAVRFIEACMKIDPSLRPSAESLLLHNFVANIDDEVADIGAAAPPPHKAQSDTHARSKSQISWSL